ncbi:MAG: hypothetical protein KC800_01480 [Candidatus Eremiobacteraeota bacterium]|nr:hypothetical protein [Candidatus Eremiobacteraeota bacterium]
MAIATQILVWFWLFGCGFLVTRRVLRCGDPWLLLGASVPVAMLCVLGIFFPLALLIGHPQGWTVGSLLVFVATMTLLAKRHVGRMEPIKPFGFSPFQWGCFMTLLTAANLVMHTRETVGPASDYWIHFPLISLLNRGEFPPPNPFFDNLTLHGHFGRDYLVAIIGWYAGDGIELLKTNWTYYHILSVSAFFLAFGLGRRVAGTAGGFLMSSFLFFGISVGSRVGMMDTYDNNNLLVYCLILLFVAFETTVDNYRAGDVFLGLALGVYGIIYETHLVLFLMTVWVGPLLWRRPASGVNIRSWRRPLMLSITAGVLAACLGGPLQDLALRATGLREGKVDHAAYYQAQRVQLKFPKEHLFQIMVGPETYRRLSYVYQGQAFEGLQQSTGNAGMSARSDFHYAFILSPDVLLMHWLALYLGLPAGFWLWRRKCPEGQALWVFGLVAFLVPAVFDFGPVHEREYFRWEFAAGFGCAGALAATLAILWNARGRPWRVAVVVLALLVTLGGERRINRTMIEIEEMPAHKRERAVTPWYPSPREWILNSPELRMDEDMLEAALKLRFRSGPHDRMLTDIDVRKHWDIHQEATVVALAGLRSVGHVSPPPWMPDGNAPFFRTAGWNAFWQTGDIRILPFLNSRWLYSADPEKAELLEEKEGLKKLDTFGHVSLWRYEGSLEPKTAPPPEGVRVVEIERPTNRELLGEVAKPMRLTLENAPTEDFDLGVQWIPVSGTDTGGQVEPLTLRVKGGQKTYDHYLVAPLVEGSYRLQFTINGHPIERIGDDSVLEFQWSREAKMARVTRFEGEEVLFDPGEGMLEPPLRIGLRLFRLDGGSYTKPFGFEAIGVWDGNSNVVLKPLEENFRFQLPESVRADLFLLDRSGREVELPIEERVPVPPLEDKPPS